MSSDDHWSEVLVSEAMAQHASVTEAVKSRTKDLLKGRLSNQPLSSAALTSIAMDLIKDMAPSPQETDTKQ